MRFSDYKLNKFRNFIIINNDAFINCSEQELLDFCNNTINNCDCDNPGIFIHHLDDRMSACIRADVYDNANGIFDDDIEYGLDFDDDFYRRYGMLRWNIANPKECFNDDDYLSEELDPEVVEMELISIPEEDMEFFAAVDSDYRLCCYSIFVEVKKDVWQLITE